MVQDLALVHFPMWSPLNGIIHVVFFKMDTVPVKPANGPKDERG
jgi:hypothetical protein